MRPGAFRSVLPLHFLNRGQGQHRWRLREYVGKKLIPIDIPIVVGKRLGLVAQLIGQQAGAGPVRLSLDDVQRNGRGAALIQPNQSFG